MSYDINYLMQTLKNIKDNPYGIRYTSHFLKRSFYRNVDMDLLNRKLLSEVRVGIQKTLGYDNRFELIFEYTK
ncbi:MAG: hypothetical protein IJL02_01385 [Methanobrevibacter sp.]|uniref:hypothetical protein n=1 Tax=Methanobrevibacter sp. TaxID=66852 RepID=UPI0025CCD623|nr:hypothetical protein [Methanobrevibacter sp.]MBQ6098500.1 hypothetical protein [Methanobrevibacter sp.]